MGKYTKFEAPRAARKPWTIHPIWRGIGCLLLVLIPILSYAGAVLLVQTNLMQGWIFLPRELIHTVTLPLVGPVPFLLANLLTALLLSLLGFGVLTLLYTLVYKMVGPSRYGPLDAPPERRPNRRRN
ncbi:MAG TPA: hypothetical protein VF498_08775 [Anaerolineales bacterium]